MKEKLIRYSMQIAMLQQLLSRDLITNEEYALAKQKIMRDYKIVSDITTHLCYNKCEKDNNK